MKTQALYLAVFVAAFSGSYRAECGVFHVATSQELQTALSISASNGEDDTILLAGGVYPGNFTFNTKEPRSLLIRSETNALPGQVVLDGLKSGCVLNLNADTNAVAFTVEALTIKNGSGLAGLAIKTAGTVMVESCVLKDTVVDGGGGNLNVDGSANLSVLESEISGGTYSKYGWSETSDVGGIAAKNIKTVLLRGNVIRNNYHPLEVSARDIVFSANEVEDCVGGDYGTCNFYTGGSITVSNNLFRSITGKSAPINVNGYNCQVDFVSNSLMNSTNTWWAGCLAINAQIVRCERNVIMLNQGTTCTIDLTAEYSVVFGNNLVVSNRAGSYGNICVSSGASSTNCAVNNTFFGNSSARGGGLYLNTGGPSATSRSYVYNNIFWDNRASESGGDVYVVAGGALRHLYNNSFHSMSGLWDVALNNIDVAPLFVDQARGDYHLRANSLCINAGNNAAPGLSLLDKDGLARIGNGIVDMGCYEHDSSDKHPADTNSNWGISGTEFTAYAKAWTNNSAWATGPNPIPIDFVTRAGFLSLTNGGTYQNAGGGKPLNWKP